MINLDAKEQNKFDAKNFLRELEYPKNYVPIPIVCGIVCDSFEKFSENLQIVINLYFKISQGSGRGNKDFSVKFLLARCINDIMAGFHLAKHGYFIQSYSVTRPILESLDKVELFLRDEKWAKVWVNNPDKARRELTPPKVRKLLGKKSYDELYGHFCEMGSHPTFMSGRAMAGMSSEEGSIPNIRIWLGGAIFEHMFIFTFEICFLLLELILSKIIASYPEKLSSEEVCESLEQTLSNWIEFSESYSMPFFTRHNIDATPSIALQKSLKNQISRMS